MGDVSPMMAAALAIGDTIRAVFLSPPYATFRALMTMRAFLYPLSTFTIHLARGSIPSPERLPYWPGAFAPGLFFAHD